MARLRLPPRHARANSADTTSSRPTLPERPITRRQSHRKKPAPRHQPRIIRPRRATLMRPVNPSRCPTRTMVQTPTAPRAITGRTPKRTVRPAIPIRPRVQRAHLERRTPVRKASRIPKALPGRSRPSSPNSRLRRKSRSARKGGNWLASRADGQRLFAALAISLWMFKMVMWRQPPQSTIRNQQSPDSQRPNLGPKTSAAA